jgi:hypothetical protein
LKNYRHHPEKRLGSDEDTPGRSENFSSPSKTLYVSISVHGAVPIMKCPHCGIEVRDNTVVCGYCGEKIARKRQEPTAGGGARHARGGAAPAPAAAKRASAQSEADEDDEGGGFSAILQPEEQILIGSLNVSVKKFVFNAYLTNQRIFLLDTQEKKIKVTAKDIPRDTITGSIVEFSEDSDPVLVLSVKSTDDEIKTMKLVFVQEGTDRFGEIDEWIALLHGEEREEHRERTHHRREERYEEEEEEHPPVKKTPPRRQELQPPRRPTKDHERQPPVKKIISPYRDEEEEQEYVPEPPRRQQVQVRTAPDYERHHPDTPREHEREVPRRQEYEPQQSKKPEVQSAMRVAMKSAMQPLRQQPPVQMRRPADEPVASKRAIVQQRPVEPEPAYIRESPREHEDAPAERHEPENPDAPQFCHHCGKKLPAGANFCPNCGTKVTQHKTKSSHAAPPAAREKAAEKRPEPAAHDDEDEDDGVGEKPVVAKPPVRKAPKGSEMTILHKFLRR